MSDKDLKKVFAILYDLKKSIKKIENDLTQRDDRKCRPGRSERSKELLHGESPSG